MAQGSHSAENGKLGGRPKGSISKERLAALGYLRALIEEATANKKELARALVGKGLTGDVPALKEIHDRLLGKAKEQLEVMGKDGAELNMGLSSSDKDFIVKLFGHGHS